MFGQMNQMMQLMQAMRNPQQFLQRMGIPQENLNSPQDVEKFLLDQGKINQQPQGFLQDLNDYKRK